MNKRFVAGITLCSFLSLGVPVVAEDPVAVSAPISAPTIKVESGKGDVTLRGIDAGRPVKAGDVLGVGDTVRLGGDAALTLLMSDGSRVRVSPNSEFRLKLDERSSRCVYLLSGKVMSAVQSGLMVETYRSTAYATTGEFVVEASPSKTSLTVLSGDAQMWTGQQSAPFNLLGGVAGEPGADSSSLVAFGRLAQEQIVTDVEFGAQSKGKGQGVRRERQPETGGVGRVLPNQDMLPPGENPAAVTETPPPTTTPATTTPVTTTPTTTTATTTTAASTGTPVWQQLLYGVGGLGLIIGAIAIVTNDSDDRPSPSNP